MDTTDEKPVGPGRPSLYSDALGEEICLRLVDGESLRNICRDTAMPCVRTVFNWLETDKDFCTKYAKARELQADLEVDDILDIADDGTNDWVTRQRGNVTVTEVNHDHIARSRLRVETRKWRAEKLKPKKYGQKVQAELSGPDGKPIQQQVLAAIAATDDPNEAAKFYADLINGTG
jgi:hypothetical protein